jgi:hypothetical protein
MHDSSEFLQTTRQFYMIPLMQHTAKCLPKYDDTCLPTFFLFFTLQNQSFPSQKGAKVGQFFTLSPPPLHWQERKSTSQLFNKDKRLTLCYNQI